jgi:L-arabinose isomerase
MSKTKIGILGLALELYKTLSPGVIEGREQWVRQAVVPALGGMDAHFTSAACTADEIDAAVRDCESARCDAIIVILLTYSPSLAAAGALKRTALPILVWNTQELFSVDQSFTTREMLDNHGVHGTQDLCNVLLRAGVKFHYVTSHLLDDAGAAEIADFASAAAAAAAVRRSRVGMIGHPFPGMGDMAFDTAFMTSTLGASPVHISVREYNEACDAADGGETSRLVSEYKSSYLVADDVSQQDLQSTAKAELGVRSLIKRHRLDALTFQFLALGDDSATRTMPFVGISRLMGEGVGFGGECDCIASVGTLLLDRLAAPATFSEIFTIDFGHNAVLMSHMGEMNPAMSKSPDKPRLVVRPNIAPTIDRQLVLTPRIAAGPATLCSLTLGPNSRWRIIASSAQILDYQCDLVMPHFKLGFAGDVRDVLTSYARAGGPHHNAVCFGDARRRLSMAAGMMDADYIQLD